MSYSPTDWMIKTVSQWLLKEDPPQRAYQGTYYRY